MKSDTAQSDIFAHSEHDYAPVLAALVHLLFVVYLIVGFSHRPWWVSVILGFIYAASLCWNISCISHRFIHAPFFKSPTLNRAFGLLESVLIGFSQTYYHWLHMRRHAGNADRIGTDGATLDWLSIYRHGRNGQPEGIWSYMFCTPMRIDPRAIAHEIGRFHPELIRQAKIENKVAIGVAILAFIYNPFAFTLLVPFYYLGHCLFALNTYFEHLGSNPDVPLAWGTSSHNPIYNLLWFNNGYHAEHHYRPSVHWSDLPTFHEEIKELQSKAGTHVISTCHVLGFLARENRTILNAQRLKRNAA